MARVSFGSSWEAMSLMTSKWAKKWVTQVERMRRREVGERVLVVERAAVEEGEVVLHDHDEAVLEEEEADRVDAELEVVSGSVVLGRAEDHDQVVGVELGAGEFVPVEGGGEVVVVDLVFVDELGAFGVGGLDVAEDPGVLGLRLDDPAILKSVMMDHGGISFAATCRAWQRRRPRNDGTPEKMHLPGLFVNTDRIQ